MSLWWQKCVLFFLCFMVYSHFGFDSDTMTTPRHITSKLDAWARPICCRDDDDDGDGMRIHDVCLGRHSLTRASPPDSLSDVVIFRNAFHAVGHYRSALTRISYSLHVVNARHRRDRWINGIAHVWRIVNIKTIITSPLFRSHETRFVVCHALCFCSLRAWAHISQNPEKRIKIEARSYFLLAFFSALCG